MGEELHDVLHQFSKEVAKSDLTESLENSVDSRGDAVTNQVVRLTGEYKGRKLMISSETYPGDAEGPRFEILIFEGDVSIGWSIEKKSTNVLVKFLFGWMGSKSLFGEPSLDETFVLCGNKEGSETVERLQSSPRAQMALSRINTAFFQKVHPDEHIGVCLRYHHKRGKGLTVPWLQNAVKQTFEICEAVMGNEALDVEIGGE